MSKCVTKKPAIGRGYGIRGGFTLIELLLVMVIIAILAAVVVPKFTGRTQQARVSAAKADISNLKLALQTFETDNDRFPTTEEGLQALVTKPAAELPGWKHAYIEKMPVDPWGHAYAYHCPGANNADFDLYSYGPSGQDQSGGGDNIQ